jgi:ABC-type polysaccharide/polyol phosphate transport system ATPase subunit
MTISVENLTKTFFIPHEKRLSIRDHLVHLFSGMSYEKFEALKNVSFEVENGQWLGIIGDNGAGKSTLLKILAGIYVADSGKVIIDGKAIPFLELGVGFQPELSARDNIYLNGLLLGLSKKEITEKFDEIVKFAEIRHFIDQKLKNYSSGMKIRLGFAVAIHAPANIFLIDEILAVGDQSFQQKSLETFKNKLKNKTVVFVSHDMNRIKENCQKVLWLDNGCIKMLGTPNEVIDAYLETNNSKTI